MGYGGFNNWQFAQVFAVLALLMCVALAVRLARKPTGQRINSRSAWLLGLFVVVAVVNVAWYVADSKPYWDARARLNDSYDILEDVIDIEMTNANRYGPITVLDSWRPRTWPPNCIRGRLEGGGSAQFAQPLTDQHIEDLAVYLEEQGFTVLRRRSLPGSPPSYAVNAVRDETSYLYSFRPLGDRQSITSGVDILCAEDVELAGNDCTNCIDSFLTEPS